MEALNPSGVRQSVRCDANGNLLIVDNTGAEADYSTIITPLNSINGALFTQSVAGKAFYIRSAASTNGTAVTTVDGNSSPIAAWIYDIVLHNSGVAAAYFKLYDDPALVVGTTVPKLVIKLPADTTVVVNFAKGFNPRMNGGGSSNHIGSGFSFAITALATTADTTAVAADQVVGSLVWNTGN